MSQFHNASSQRDLPHIFGTFNYIHYVRNAFNEKKRVEQIPSGPYVGDYTEVNVHV